MEGDIFIPLSFLDWILSHKSLSKLYNFLEVKFETDVKLNHFDFLFSSLNLKKLPLGYAKDEHFSFFQRSCQIGSYLTVGAFKL